MTAQPVLYRIFGRDGEYDRQAMKELIRAGEVTSLTDVTVSGSETWKTAGMYPELRHYLAIAAPKTAATPAQDAHRASLKQIAVATVIIAIGLFFAVDGWSDLANGIASRRWPAAEAQLLDAQVRRSYSTRRRGRRQVLRVTYRYMVNGRRYLGNRVAFGHEWFTTANRQLTDARRQPLQIHYKPGLPRIAVMRPGATTGAMFGAFVGTFAIIAGALMLFKPEAATRLQHRITEMSKVRLRSS